MKKKWIPHIVTIMAFVVFIVLGLASASSGPARETLPQPFEKKAEKYFKNGGSLFEKKDYSRALTEFNKAIEINPNHATAYVYRGSANHNLNRLELAMTDYKKSLEIDPNHIYASFTNTNIALIYMTRNDHENAEIFADRALAINPNNQRAIEIKSQIVTVRARTELASGRINIQNGVTSISTDEYANKSLISVIIPNSVTIIEEGAFRKNKLTSVVIPDSVARIGGRGGQRIGMFLIGDQYIGAFSENQLTDITIGKSVTSIGGYAFSHNKLTNVIIPEGVTSIGEGAFYCNQLTSVIIPDSVTSIGNCAFQGNNLTNVVIGKNVTIIGDEAFVGTGHRYGDSEYGINQITRVIIPNSVISIGVHAFNNNQLITLEIGNSVTSIGDFAFRDNQLTNVVIPNNVTSIGRGAFRANKISNVIIGNAVTSVGDNAFSDNPLTSVTIGDGISNLNENVFSGSLRNLSRISIGSNVNLHGYSDVVWRGFSSFYNSNGNRAGIYILTDGRWNAQYRK